MTRDDDILTLERAVDHSGSRFLASATLWVLTEQL
jgi:hypothetical protein